MESRSIPRVGVDLAAEITSGDLSQALPARTRDIGIGGACLATISPFSYRSVRRVTLHMPDGILSVAARGMWQRVEHTENVVLTGVEFIDPDERSMDRLWDLVMDCGKTLARFLHGDTDLRNLSPDEAVGISHASRWRAVPTGRYVYRDDVARSGDASIFLVHSGSIVLQLRMRGAIDRPIARLGPGRLFGGLALLAEPIAGESAIAHSDARLLEINHASFGFLCATKPWLAQRIALAVTLAYARRAATLLGDFSQRP
jgi:CRP-like cAMP-binding protein